MPSFQLLHLIDIRSLISIKVDLTQSCEHRSNTPLMGVVGCFFFFFQFLPVETQAFSV